MTSSFTSTPVRYPYPYPYPYPYLELHLDARALGVLLEGRLDRRAHLLAVRASVRVRAWLRVRVRVSVRG